MEHYCRIKDKILSSGRSTKTIRRYEGSQVIHKPLFPIAIRRRKIKIALQATLFRVGRWNSDRGEPRGAPGKNLRLNRRWTPGPYRVRWRFKFNGYRSSYVAFWGLEDPDKTLIGSGSCLFGSPIKVRSFYGCFLLPTIPMPRKMSRDKSEIDDIVNFKCHFLLFHRCTVLVEP